MIIIFFGNQADGNGHILAFVFGFNIKLIHSAVDLGNQSVAACESFCIVWYELKLRYLLCRWGPASQVA